MKTTLPATLPLRHPSDTIKQKKEAYPIARKNAPAHPLKSKTFRECDSVYLVRDIDGTPAKRGMEAIITDVFHDRPQIAYNISLYHGDWWGAVSKNDIQKEKIP